MELVLAFFAGEAAPKKATKKAAKKSTKKTTKKAAKKSTKKTAKKATKKTAKKAAKPIELTLPRDNGLQVNGSAFNDDGRLFIQTSGTHATAGPAGHYQVVASTHSA